MKKIILILSLCLGLALMLVGCSSGDNGSSNPSSGVSETSFNGTFKYLGQQFQTNLEYKNTSNPMVFSCSISLESGTATVWLKNPKNEIVYGPITATPNTPVSYNNSFSNISGSANVWTLYISGSSNVSGTATYDLRQNY